MNVLHVCASPRPFQESVTKQLAARFFEKLTELNPDVNVTNVDLYQNPPPFLSYAAYRALWLPVYIPGYQPTEEEKKAAAYAYQQAQQFRDSDVVVLSTPMWNFGLPAIMKAWFDQVMVPNLVFSIENGEVRPSHQVRKVVILASADIPLKEDDPMDTVTPLIRAIMGFLHVTDIASAWADAQGTPDAERHRQVAMEAAEDLAEEIASYQW